MASEDQPVWLLIGNSRWHWARGWPGHLHCWSEAPPGSEAWVDQALVERLSHLRSWAAVGPLPSLLDLDPRKRLTVDRVPLAASPPWLGVDRALVGWLAYQQSCEAVLVADAGTALSLTLVDGGGTFRGGRIQAGLALQLKALAGGTAHLPQLGFDQGAGATPLEAWPSQTSEAMLKGIRVGLTAAVLQGWHEAKTRFPQCQLWITGGDGSWLAAEIGLPWKQNMALEALVALSSEAPNQQEWCQPLFQL